MNIIGGKTKIENKMYLTREETQIPNDCDFLAHLVYYVDGINNALHAIKAELKQNLRCICWSSLRPEVLHHDSTSPHPDWMQNTEPAKHRTDLKCNNSTNQWSLQVLPSHTAMSLRQSPASLSPSQEDPTLAFYK